MAIVALAILVASPSMVRGSITDRGSVASICDSAAVVASRESGVPLEVLRAISLTETGRRSDEGFRPWPWTVNMEGVGKWFEDVSSARRYVDRHFVRGARSFDVGCFQINYRWHGAAFRSLDEMFDPILNARYAANFLMELYTEFGSWSLAAGAYHSRTPKFARRYSARFDQILAGLTDYPSENVVPNDQPVVGVELRRANSFPLLQLEGVVQGASLVPLSERGNSMLSERAGRPPVATR